MTSAALVLFSGGQDSTVCLAWALDKFDRVDTVGFNYNQRHRIELECRLKIREIVKSDFPAWGSKLGRDHFIDLAAFGAISPSSLTRNIEIAFDDRGMPNTSVPGRNLAFLVFAAALASACNITHLVGGMCEADQSGYPDCRDDTLKALQVAINLGMDRRFVFHTPLMWLDKAETWALAHQLGGPRLVEAIVEYSHTCFRGDRTQKHDWGYGCGTCPACQLRSEGWNRFSQDRMARPLT